MLINVISRECFLLSGYYLLIKKPVDDNYYVSLYFFFFFFFNFGDTFHWLDDNRAFTMQEARAFVSPTGANIDTHSQTNNAWFLALRFFFFFFFFFHHDAEIRKNASLATVSINFNFNHPMSHGYFQIFQLILHYRSPYLTFHLFYFTIRLQIIYIYVHR